MSSRHGSEVFALWDRFNGRRHIVATMIQSADGIRWRTLCGRDYRRPDPPSDTPCGYCRACRQEKAAVEQQKVRS